MDPEIVFAAGASGFRGVVPAGEVAGVVKGYSRAVDDVFYLTAGCAAAAFVTCMGMGWKSVKKAKGGELGV